MCCKEEEGSVVLGKLCSPCSSVPMTSVHSQPPVASIAPRTIPHSGALAALLAAHYLPLSLFLLPPSAAAAVVYICVCVSCSRAAHENGPTFPPKRTRTLWGEHAGVVVVARACGGGRRGPLHERVGRMWIGAPQRSPILPSNDEVGGGGQVFALCTLKGNCAWFPGGNFPSARGFNALFQWIDR